MCVTERQPLFTSDYLVSLVLNQNMTRSQPYRPHFQLHYEKVHLCMLTVPNSNRDFEYFKTPYHVKVFRWFATVSPAHIRISDGS